SWTCSSRRRSSSSTGPGSTGRPPTTCASSPSRGGRTCRPRWSGWATSSRATPSDGALMCGRYAATANPEELVEAYEVEVDATAEPSRSVLKNPQQPPPGQPDHNVAPSKQAPVVLTRAPKD